MKNKREEIVEFATECKNLMIKQATEELEKQEEKLAIRIKEGKKVAKLTDKIETLKSFIKAIESLSNTVKIIKTYEELTNTRGKAMYDADFIKEINE